MSGSQLSWIAAGVAVFLLVALVAAFQSRGDAGGCYVDVVAVAVTATAGKPCQRERWFFFRAGVYLVQSYDRNTRKVWLGSRAPTVLSGASSAEILRQTVLNALYESELDVDVSGRSNLTGPLLAAAGVKRYSTLTNGLKSVGVDADDESGALVLDVLPTYRDAADYASRLGESRRVFTFASPEQAEREVLRALELTTPA